MSDIRICARDNEPLVWTFEFPGSEWFCVICGAHEDLFGLRTAATPELVRRADELTARYERDRAEREGREYMPRLKVGDEGVEAPMCKTCGAIPEPGTLLDSDGKPFRWFSRTVDGVTEYACKRTCIPDKEAVLPW